MSYTYNDQIEDTLSIIASENAWDESILRINFGVRFRTRDPMESLAQIAFEARERRRNFRIIDEGHPDIQGLRKALIKRRLEADNRYNEENAHILLMHCNAHYYVRSLVACDSKPYHLVSTLLLQSLPTLASINGFFLSFMNGGAHTVSGLYFLHIGLVALAIRASYRLLKNFFEIVDELLHNERTKENQIALAGLSVCVLAGVLTLALFPHALPLIVMLPLVLIVTSLLVDLIRFASYRFSCDERSLIPEDPRFVVPQADPSADPGDEAVPLAKQQAMEEYMVGLAVQKRSKMDCFFWSARDTALMDQVRKVKQGECDDMARCYGYDSPRY